VRSMIDLSELSSGDGDTVSRLYEGRDCLRLLRQVKSCQVESHWSPERIRHRRRILLFLYRFELTCDATV